MPFSTLGPIKHILLSSCSCFHVSIEVGAIIFAIVSGDKYSKV